MVVNVVYGFLGAGKTTFIRYLMENPPQTEKVVILVNEFGEVGIDGLVLSGHGAQVAQVVELPSGCICCTIAWDFRRQLLELSQVFSPDRIIIEPTGVATISQILQILESEDMRPLYSHLELIHILDASELLSFIKSHRNFMENQIRRSTSVLLNKMDRVKPVMLDLLVSCIKEINPKVMVYPTRFGRLDERILNKLLKIKGDSDQSSEDSESRDQNTPYIHVDDHGLAQDFDSFGRKYTDSFSRPCLESFFDGLKSGRFGKVVRAKGIFLINDEWIKLELASGEVLVEIVPSVQCSALSIIGQEMKTRGMDAVLDECRTN
jgi:G3E family GTPase